jgi:hypothetical protein
LNKTVRFCCVALVTLAVSILAASTADITGAAAQSGTLPRPYFNEAYAEEAMRATVLETGNPMAVFAFVLGSLPDRVKVYPTENYYYFYFIHQHVRYAGNFRLDIIDRDEGKVHFTYYKDFAEWMRDESAITHVVLDGAAGVTVEKIAPLTYRVSHDGKAVAFELNDLSHVQPPPGSLGTDEVYVGPIFDESAIRFFLVFNRKLKIFHYILDESIDVADEFVPISATDHIQIGRRTGFAFYRDDRLNRKILIGVFEGNTLVNNYFDGPFDQLPDNFIEGEALRDAILAAAPRFAGKIDRFGISPDRKTRYLIGPYRRYRTEKELVLFHTCATDKRIPPARYYECFVFDEGDAAGTGQARARSRMRDGPDAPVAKRGSVGR